MLNHTSSNTQVHGGLAEAAQQLAYVYVGAAAFHQKSASDKV